MEQLLLLLGILAGGAHAFPALAEVPVTKCDFSSRVFLIYPPCTPALGGTVYIKLMDNATGYLLLFTKDLPDKNLNVFVVKEGKLKIRQEYRNRTEFSISTGTLKLTEVERNDTGQYTLWVFTTLPNPMCVEIIKFRLEIEENHSFSISIDLPVELCVVLIVVIVCCVIWKLKPRRKSGYQRLTGS